MPVAAFTLTAPVVLIFLANFLAKFFAQFALLI